MTCGFYAWQATVSNHLYARQALTQSNVSRDQNFKLLKIIEAGQVGHKVYLADGQVKILTFDCPAKSKHKPPVWDFRVGICLQVAFNFG